MSDRRCDHGDNFELVNQNLAFSQIEVVSEIYHPWNFYILESIYMYRSDYLLPW